MKYAKGTGPVSAKFAQGGEVLNETRSRFMKTPDVFRTDIERTDYEKKGKGGELAKMEGDSKSETPVKPRT
jgi:hypothetical protein